VATSLTLHFAADYADIYEVHGLKRRSSGEDLPPEVTEDWVVLGYRGLDGVVRRTQLHCTPRPSLLTAAAARLDLALRPQQEATFALTVACERQPAAARLLPFEDARAEAEADLQHSHAWSCHLRTSNGQVNAWVNRAVSDLHMMTTELRLRAGAGGRARALPGGLRPAGLVGRLGIPPAAGLSRPERQRARRPGLFQRALFADLAGRVADSQPGSGGGGRRPATGTP
jgi:hypothetical protein